MRYGAILRNDVEDRPAKCPPRIGQLAIGDHPVMKDVFILQPLRPLSLKIEGAVGGEHARPGNYVSPGPPAHVVVFSALRSGVVFNTVRVQFLIFHVLVECYVAARLGIAGFIVVVDFLGGQKNI